MIHFFVVIEVLAHTVGGAAREIFPKAYNRRVILVYGGYEGRVTGLVDASFILLLHNYVIVIFCRGLINPSMCYEIL